MRVFTWFWLSCKRQLKHMFFIVALLLVPLCLLAFSRLERQDSGKIKIGVYSEDADFVPEVFDVLLSQDGMFEFYVCDSGEMLKDEVASRKAECGFVFREEFKGKLDDGDFKRSIMVYSAPSTIAADLAKEVVFAGLFEVYGEELLERFAEESGIFADLDSGRVQAELLTAYHHEMSNGSTYSFQYETLSTEQIEGGTARVAFPVRGMLAIYLMTVGLFSMVALRQDESRGLFITLSHLERIPCQLASAAAPVCMAGGSVLVTLLVTGNADHGVGEVPLLILYMIMIMLVSYILKLLIKDPVVLCGLIPIFILCSLVVCPVFFDVGQWVPAIRAVRYLFLPYYYMNF